MRDGDTRE
jgi:uncharacterized protein YgfB (UPF0149 family)